jgi:hypothetical protein
MKPISAAYQSDISKFNQSSWKWLLGRVDYLRKNKSIPGAINKSNFSDATKFMVGEVFLYHYDPKLKHELPYYDKFPLVIPLKLYNDGFLGVNLHYLPPEMRIKFLNKLMGYLVNVNDVRLRMKITYDLLASSQHFSEFIPCLKRYLTSHINGRMLKINPHEWQMVCYLPIAIWKSTSDRTGITARQVYAESKRKIREKKGG